MTFVLRNCEQFVVLLQDPVSGLRIMGNGRALEVEETESKIMMKERRAV